MLRTTYLCVRVGPLSLVLGSIFLLCVYTGSNMLGTYVHCMLWEEFRAKVYMLTEASGDVLLVDISCTCLGSVLNSVLADHGLCCSWQNVTQSQNFCGAFACLPRRVCFYKLSFVMCEIMLFIIWFIRTSSERLTARQN